MRRRRQDSDTLTPGPANSLSPFAEEFAVLAHNLNRDSHDHCTQFGPRIRHFESHSAALRSNGMRPNFRTDFCSGPKSPQCEIAAPVKASRDSQLEKMREKPRKSRFFRAVKL
jgi:hypothetical protein